MSVSVTYANMDCIDCAARNGPMQILLQDLRYATRQPLRNLGLTITAVVSLALGIGATTAVFSVIYATLMNPYPYPAADRIVRLTVSSKVNSSDGINLNGPQVKQLQQLHSVEGVLAIRPHESHRA